MRFYGIVNQLRQPSGVYGRIPPDRTAVTHVAKTMESASWSGEGAALAFLALGKLPLLALFVGVKLARYFLRDRPIKRQSRNATGEVSMMILPDQCLNDDYSLSDSDKKILHGLVEQPSQFKALMRAEGGSELFVLERAGVAALGLKHYGSDNGSFSPGVYCEHPKDTSVLLPLSNAKAILESEILEETLSVFEALGATGITIEDITELSSDVGGKHKGVKVGAEAGFAKRVLRKKRFEPLGVDVARAERPRRHVYDLPNIVAVMEARRDGNQTYEHFEEVVDVSCGLGADVLGAFGASVKASYHRRWSFEVEFMSKAPAA